MLRRIHETTPFWGRNRVAVARHPFKFSTSYGMVVILIAFLKKSSAIAMNFHFLLRVELKTYKSLAACRTLFEAGAA